MKFLDFFKSKWEIIQSEARPVYLKGRIIGIEVYTTKKHKTTGEIKKSFSPAIP